jgi:3-oxoacyl-[acyl-carrier protein] reductase
MIEIPVGPMRRMLLLHHSNGASMRAPFRVAGSLPLICDRSFSLFLVADLEGCMLTSAGTALITGASRGIGLGVAERLAGRGYSLTIAGRDDARLRDVADTLRAKGANTVSWLAGDILDDDYLARLVQHHGECFGAMDALITNAGAGSAGAIAEFHPKRFDRQLATNLRSAFVVVQAALPLLRSAADSSDKGAKIVAMASMTGIYAEPELAAYGAAKAGLISLCRSINLEENANGVQATAVAPGYVDTAMSAWKHGELESSDMITIDDVVEVVDMCLRLSRRAVVPEVVIARSGSASQA